MEERKDGKKQLTGDLDVTEIQQGEWTWSGGNPLRIIVTPEAFQAFAKWTDGKYNDDGPDELTISASVGTAKAQVNGHEVAGKLEVFRHRKFKTAFAPGPVHGCLRCLIAGEPYKITGIQCPPDEWKTLADGLTERNAVLGFVIPEGEPQPDNVLKPIREDFAIAAGFVPMHKLVERNRAGLPLFSEESRTFHNLRTPLNVATGLALFYFTMPDRPGDWQEVTIHALTDQVFCLTDRGAPRRGDQVPDVLGEVVKLFTETIAVVAPRFEKCGHFYKSRVEMFFFRVIAELGLTYLDKETKRLVRPDDPRLPTDAVVPLNVKGRRVFTPDGKDIKSLIGDRYQLESIRWHWTPSIVSDLLATPALDKKGNVIRDKKGNAILGGYNIAATRRIFDALFRLRSEKAYIAHNLLVLLAFDIYKPPKQSNAARNIVEREAGRLYDLLGLEADPKHPRRREEAVVAAIFRLKQSDIGALLAGSDELPRTDPNRDRRKGSYYRLIRSALYTPPGILTKDEGAAIEAEQASELLALPDPKTKADQVALPGITEAAPPIPSGSSIRAAREAAGLNLRRFAEVIGGPSFKTWSNYETGKPIRVKPEVWQRVREFIAGSGKKDA
ncbi:MAG: helix-turn-helix transcriptional regulator [Pseudorhodobacter sp.]|nr:helix-turn-helix transcriptional regulator [Pseudorhodobacter sp.]MDZ4241650.1 helix-turn-helix transcriptional regulator [Candidatus Omnitrophota bacterium]